MVSGPYLLCSFLGCFCRPPAGTMAAEVTFWGEEFSVFDKRGRFRMPKTSRVNPIQRRRAGVSS